MLQVPMITLFFILFYFIIVNERRKRAHTQGQCDAERCTICGGQG